MPPKPDASAVVELKLRCIGGQPANMAILAPKLGPLGVPPKKASDVIQADTKEWAGLKITVKLIIQNRNPRVEVIASSTALVLKALNEPARDRKKVKNIKHDGNLSLNDVYNIARAMRSRSQAKKFSGTVLEILGTCTAIGCSVEGQKPAVLTQQIKNGELQVPDA